jgi:hypothetical protein
LSRLESLLITRTKQTLLIQYMIDHVNTHRENS